MIEYREAMLFMEKRSSKEDEHFREHQHAAYDIPYNELQRRMSKTSFKPSGAAYSKVLARQSSVHLAIVK